MGDNIVFRIVVIETFYEVLMHNESSVVQLMFFFTILPCFYSKRKSLAITNAIDLFRKRYTCG